MTIASETIIPSGAASGLGLSSFHQAEAPGNSPGRPHTKPGDPLSPIQAQVLAALRATGSQAKAARMVGIAVTNLSLIMRALRLKGAIGPDEYRHSLKPRKGKRDHHEAEKRKPASKVARSWAVGPGRPLRIGTEYDRTLERRAEAFSELRVHVCETIHYARRDHVLSSFHCSCGVRLRVINRDRERGHAQLAALVGQHMRGPDVRGAGKRDRHGRLVAE